MALTYLSKAASDSAAVESAALSSGLKKGGAAKGELVLAIYELANSFRHGWGVEKDPVAARSYYETAANLGDTDAMNEVARCYEEGFGGKKDKVCLVPYFFLSTRNAKGLGILSVRMSRSPFFSLVPAIRRGEKEVASVCLETLSQKNKANRTHI